MPAPYPDQPGVGQVPLGSTPYGGSHPGLDVGPDPAALLAWARRLAAVEGEVQAIGLAVRAAALEVATPDPIGEALTELVRRSATEVAALGHRIGVAARLLAAESMRAAR